jgi:ABC-2 type transport system ATP-binding protein
MPTNGAAIEAIGLTRRFGDHVAVAGIDLAIMPGRIYALLGPNGAGKTTTINMLTTLTPPSSGTARVAGFDVQTRAADVRKRIGVTFQDIILDNDLSGRQVLDIHGRLYRQPRDERHRRITELVSLVQLQDAVDRPVKTYSGGMKRRLELARGLMTNPEVLFLDEPTQGLDPQNRAGIWQYIRDLRRERGITLLLTTHYMEEAETLADIVGIIDHGQMRAEGPTSDLIAALGHDIVRIRGEGDQQHLHDRLAGMAFVAGVQLDAAAGTLSIYVDNGSRRVAELVGAAGGNGFRIEDITLSRPTLGDVFLHHTGHALRD